MAIQKTPPTVLRQAGLHYTTITNEVLHLIKNPDSVAIWTYLLSQSDNWIVRPTDIKNRFSIGKDRYLNAMSELRNLGLVFSVIVRDGKGQIESKSLVCSNIPDDWIKLNSPTMRAENPPHGQTHTMDYQHHGETAHIIKDQSLINNQKVNNNGNSSVDYKNIQDQYHAFCTKLQEVRKLSVARKRTINARCDLLKTENDWTEYFKTVAQSDFLNGMNDRGWKASFDWLINETNMIKVLEGKFKNKNKPQQTTTYKPMPKPGE